jgi:hypothetical protein
MGIPDTKASTIFGDNKAVIDNAMNPHADNMKKFHSVRDAIAVRLEAPQTHYGIFLH